MAEYKPVLSVDSINGNVKNVRYAVRGKLVLQALELEKQIKSSGKGVNGVNEIIYCNIGNPQITQRPITFFRQVLSLVEYPELMKICPAGTFPQDAMDRAKRLVAATGAVGGSGAYSHSKGLQVVREDVCKFIGARDDVPCDPESVFLTDGASSGVKLILNLLIRNEKDGILTPIPQYPLYSASVAAFGGVLVPYYLCEEKCWGMDVKELERSYKEATAKGIEVRALVVINPSNPCGQNLAHDNMAEIAKFCYEKRLVLMADEVYQDNVYGGRKFVSFRKVMFELGEPYSKHLELVSYHSVSKGFMGECGKRGGYMQLENIPMDTMAEMYKMSSVSLCPNLVGQIVTDLVIMPPKQGEPSYELYQKERTTILESLSRRATKLSAALNTFEGMSCQPATGAMYLFPRVIIPKKAVEEAKKLGDTPDTFYCMELLKGTGICVIPGSGFGQVDGTYHFRTTFLPEEDKINAVVERMAVFHKQFMAKYHD
eukprot:TRINITY_DN483_c0_g1_i13.p2 TRINITY_DN483_c0_g1~~TRINITY_DN483_c0_g1_i13.p2  ORF type:complete len:486 (-),score=165.94 TRINITY_DN483_c0_g1_i13:1888-3345(-)